MTLLFGATAASAVEDKELRIGVLTPVLEFSQGPGPLVLTAEFRVSGPQFARVEVSLVDLAVDASGLKAVVPLGSTPSSMKGIARVGGHAMKYIPNGKVQVLAARVVIDKPEVIKRAVSGGVQLKLVGEDKPGSGINLVTRAAAVATVVYAPPGVQAVSAKAKFVLGAISLEPAIEPGWVDRWLPNPPGWINTDMPVARWNVRNPGNIYVGVRQIIRVRSAGFTGPAEGKYLFNYEGPRAVLLPKQSSIQGLPLAEKVLGSNRLIGVLPEYGFYEVQVLAQAVVNGKVFSSQISTYRVFYLPWQRYLLGLILAGTYLYARRRRRKAATSKIAVTE